MGNGTSDVDVDSGSEGDQDTESVRAPSPQLNQANNNNNNNNNGEEENGDDKPLREAVTTSSSKDHRGVAGRGVCVTPHSQHPSAIPQGFRPGRLSNIEILERVFPLQKRTVLELVLGGCNGDLVKAIEHFLSAQDTLVVQQQIALQQAAHPRHEHPGPGTNGFHPYLTAFSPFRSPLNGGNGKMSLGGSGPKSAFTPLSPPTSIYPGLHSAFTPRSAAFTTDALLGRTRPYPTLHGAVTASPPKLPIFSTPALDTRRFR